MRNRGRGSCSQNLLYERRISKKKKLKNKNIIKCQNDLSWGKCLYLEVSGNIITRVL